MASLQSPTYSSKPRALANTSEEISNDNTKNMFIRIYSPCHKMRKTHSKHSDDTTRKRELPDQKWSSYKNSMKYME